ncbi:MAG: lipoprotein [Pseudomonadota bacterium]
MTRFAKLILAGASVAALSACGLQGDLTRPDPLFGTPSDLEPAEPLDQNVSDSLRDLQETRRADEETQDDEPDAEDELLGGPGGF